ncbi:J-binding protein [Lotmaria passim]
MLSELTRAEPLPELTAILDAVETTGEMAIVFPSTSVGDLETITRETQRRQLRIAGIPRGGYTILPAIPIEDDDLLRLCEKYCLCHEDEKADMRGNLYLRDYPLFCQSVWTKPLFHPADYVSRIIEFCFYYVQVPDSELPSLLERCPFLHISPVKEICYYQRCVIRGTAESPESLPQQAGDANAFPLLRVHALEDVERVMASTPVTQPALLQAPATPLLPTGAASSTPIESNLLFKENAIEEDNGADSGEHVEDLTGEEMVDTVHGFQAEYFSADDFDLVTKKSIFYDCEGDGQRVVAVYLPGSIPQEVCQTAAAVLEPAATKKNLRAATNGGVPPDTGVVGYYDYLNNPTQHKCRETEFSRKNWSVFATCEPFLKLLDKLYSEMAPLHHHLQKVAIPAQYQLCGTVFSTVTVNRNFRTAVHTDRGDFRNGLGVLSVINGEFEGCHLAIKAIRKAFQLKVGDVLLFDTALEHGNTEVHSPATHWKRTSVVCYLRTGLMSSVCEMERRKHLNRLTLQQLQSTTVRQDTVNINVGEGSLPPIFVPTRLAGQLSPVQLSALGFIVERAEKESGCVVAMTMGLGKTLVALTFCFSHLHLSPKTDILILTPKLIISHWVNEKNKWAAFGLHFAHFVAPDGDRTLKFEEDLLKYDQQLRDERSRAGHIFVINSEYLSGFLRRFKNFAPSLIIVDEGHRIAAAENRMTSLLSRLRCNLRVVLSGTPLQNDANELYRVVSWVNRSVEKVLPRRRFQELASDINRFIEGNDSAFRSAVVALEYIEDWMAGFVFREMENGLPPLHDYLLVCGSSDVQKEYEEKIGLNNKTMKSMKATEHCPYHLSTHPSCYLAFISDSYRSIAGGPKTRGRDEDSDAREKKLEKSDAMRLEQYTAMVNNEQLDSFINMSGKMRALADIVLRVQARREKLIIFSLYIGSQDLIHRTLTALRVSTFTVRSRDGQDRRLRAIQEFNSNESLSVLVLSTRIAAYGLDFTAANHVVLFDSWWNPQLDAQAIARAYRRNQEKPVTVYRLISASENRLLLRSQTRKIALFRCILHERTSRAALPNELEDCTESETDEERREFWRHLKATQLAGGSPALLNVYRYQESVREKS